ncbi:MAG: hypothetical protein L6R35_006389, partial [Caloplaca aegaea]
TSVVDVQVPPPFFVFVFPPPPECSPGAKHCGSMVGTAAAPGAQRRHVQGADGLEHHLRHVLLTDDDDPESGKYASSCGSYSHARAIVWVAQACRAHSGRC